MPTCRSALDSSRLEGRFIGRPRYLATGPAARQGRVAADNICGRSTSIFRGVQGTAIVRVFDHVAACTGANAKTLARAGTPFQFIFVHPSL